IAGKRRPDNPGHETRRPDLRAFVLLLPRPRSKKSTPPTIRAACRYATACAARVASRERSWSRPVPLSHPVMRAPDCHTHGSGSAPLRDGRDARQTGVPGSPPPSVDCHTSCPPAQPSLPAPAHRKSPPPDLLDFARILLPSHRDRFWREPRGLASPSRHRICRAPRRILFPAVSPASIRAPSESQRSRVAIPPALARGPIVDGIPSLPGPNVPSRTGNLLPPNREMPRRILYT